MKVIITGIVWVFAWICLIAGAGSLEWSMDMDDESSLTTAYLLIGCWVIAMILFIMNNRKCNKKD